MWIWTSILILNVAVQFSLAVIKQIPLPAKYVECLIERTTGSTPKNLQGEEVINFCINDFLWEDSENIHRYEVEDDVLGFIREMFDKVQVQEEGEKPKRIRMEYRMLSTEQREKYHRAVNMLKEDKKIEPNVYDAIANFHRSSSVQAAHFGTAFLPWHRIFLLIFETALLEKVPDVIFPYWDPTPDSQLKNPADSVMFTDKFFGNPHGQVVSGPYANWKHESGGQLMRNVGANSQLVTNENIKDILSRTRHSEIVDTSKKGARYNIEQIHAKVHTLIGGNMGRITKAPQDPIFHSYHAYFDCVWEKFREKQMEMDIDPSTDYPETTNPLHKPDSPLDGFRTEDGFQLTQFFSLQNNGSNFKTFTNLDGFSNNFTRDIYSCADFPSCDPDNRDCRSPWLECNHEKWVCVSKTRAPDLDRLDATPVVLDSVQNRFEINGEAESDQWVYLQVPIIFERPPSVKFKSYPVHKGETVSDCDIYCEGDKVANVSISEESTPKAYEKHVTIDSGFEKVYVQSDGINYDGSVLEYAIVEQRFAISESITYVPIKKPTPEEITNVLLTAFDSAGRLCRAFCRDPDNNKRFKVCNGSISVDASEPLMFGETYADNVLSRWDFDQGCPVPNNDEVYIKFFCDFQNFWPWENYDTISYSQKIKQGIENARSE